jgi:hypothetical protein
MSRGRQQIFCVLTGELAPRVETIITERICGFCRRKGKRLMSVPSPDNRPSETAVTLRRFLSRGEAITLLGMILTVFSLFLVWKVEAPNIVLPAEFVGRMTRKGLSLPVFWPLLIGATGSAVMLLWSPNSAARMPVLILQIAFGLTCFVVTLANFAAQPGVFVALAGSALLLFGAIDRYTQASLPKHTA